MSAEAVRRIALPILLLASGIVVGEVLSVRADGAIDAEHSRMCATFNPDLPAHVMQPPKPQGC